MVCAQVFFSSQGDGTTSVNKITDDGINVSGILIAGPARCGKSTLAAVLSEAEGSVAVMTVEALFPVFLSAPAPKTLEAQREFIRTYLMRPRYMDPAKSLTRCPVDDMGGDVEAVVQNVDAPPGASAIELIAASLKDWVKSVGGKAWIAPDLNGEFYFERFLKDVPELGMVVLLRDPRAAIAASLYWRTHPERAPAPTRMLVHKLLLWCLSAEAGRRLAEKTDGRVSSVFMENLLDGSHASKGGKLAGITTPPAGAFPAGQMYFSYVDGHGWLTPDGTWKQLLSKRERRLIERISRRWFDVRVSSSAGDLIDEIIFISARTLLAVILGVGRFDPGIARTLLDVMLHPVARTNRVIRKTLSNVRRKYFYRSGQRTNNQTEVK